MSQQNDNLDLSNKDKTTNNNTNVNDEASTPTPDPIIQTEQQQQEEEQRLSLSLDEDGNENDNENDNANENDEAIRVQAGLNSPKAQEANDNKDQQTSNGQTPNTIRDQMDVNSPRRQSDQKVDWANANNGTQPKTGIEAFVTQVAPPINLITQVSPDEAALMKRDETENESKTETKSTSTGFWSCCYCLFSCCSKSSPQQTQIQMSKQLNETQDASDTKDKAQPAKKHIPQAVPNEATSSSTEKPILDDAKAGANTTGSNPNQTQSESRDASESREPSSTEYDVGILPPLSSGMKHRKCLVLDLDETLVHSSFKPIPGPDFIIPVEIENVIYRVYVKKRPYVDEFLRRTAQHYELVIFTASLAKYADPLLDKLDVEKLIPYRLFRESCSFHGSSYVKDLRRIGRKLKNTIIIDNSPNSYALQPTNAIPILSWFDDMDDTALMELLPVLETTLRNCKDVRHILDANNKSYRWLCNQANVPLENFSKKNQNNGNDDN